MPRRGCRGARSPAKKNDSSDNDPAAAPLTSAHARRRRAHMDLMQHAAQIGMRPDRTLHQTSEERNRAPRDCESTVRRRVLARARWAGWNGWTTAAIAAAVGIAPATLGHWWARWRDPQDRLQARSLGAPALAATPLERRQIRDFLTLFGCALAVTTLQDHFPTISRRDLACILHLARRDEHDTTRATTFLKALTWMTPGAVWAMDHTLPPTPIDGTCRAILTVRDLASGATLAAHPVATDDAESTVDLLKDLCARHGAPLVIKADNGPAFTSSLTRNHLRSIGTALLLSPPYCPQYNGACEAGNGTIKRLAHTLAARNARPEQWTSDDVEAARLLANRRARSGPDPRTPEERFAQRAPISDHQRQDFLLAVDRARTRRLAQLDIASPAPDHTITPDALERHAIAEALNILGYYIIRSIPIRPCNPQREVV